MNHLTSKKYLFGGIAVLLLSGMGSLFYFYPRANEPIKEPIMTEPFIFTCTKEIDHAPPLDNKEAEGYFKEARAIEAPYGRKDELKINQLYKKAADLGHWKAQYNLALRYSAGKGEGKEGGLADNQSAVDIYEAMVAQNIPLGIYGMALMLRDGKGVQYDPKMASQYMHRAADLGNPQAQYYLGKQARARYDHVLMKQYYRCALAQGNNEAAYALAMMAEISEENYPRAVYYYMQAASLGHLIAFTSLSNFFDGTDSAERYGYPSNPALITCFDDRKTQLRANPILRFPDLASECSIPLHPIMGDGSEYPDLEMREPEFLERLKVSPHDPVNEKIMGDERIQWLRDLQKKNQQSAIEKQNQPPPVKMVDLPYWVEPHVQFGTFFVKYNGTWVRAVDGYITPYILMGDDLRYIEYYGGDNEYIEENAFHTITQNILRHIMQRRNGQLS